MMRLRWLIISVVCGGTGVSAQAFIYDNNMLITGVYSQQHPNVLWGETNPACLSDLESFSAAVSAQRNFLIGELSQYRFATSIPIKEMHIGLTGSFSGMTLYNESKLAFAAARKLGKKIDLGIDIHYQGFRGAGYGQGAAAGFTAGLITHPADKWHAGFQVTNPLSSKFGVDKSELVPPFYSMLLAFEPSGSAAFNIRCSREQGKPVFVDAAISYFVLPSLQITCGFQTLTSSFFVSTAIVLGKLQCSIGCEVHPQLGISPAIVFSTRSSKKQ